jgi:hypothetical protein
MKEIWKDVIEYEGYYQISNLGNVKGLKRNKIKSPTLNSWGYYIVSLTKPDTKLKSVLVHRLVAIAFINNLENKEQVNHIDGNKTNNCVINLEWCNQSENMQHAFKLGLNVNSHGEKHNRSVITDEIYLKCVELREQGLTYAKIAEYVSKEYNIKIGRTSINAALLGQTWSHIKTKNLRSYGNRKPKAGY